MSFEEQKRLSKASSEAANIMAEAQRHQTIGQEQSWMDNRTYLLGRDRMEEQKESTIRQNLRDILLRDETAKEKLAAQNLEQVRSAMAENDAYMARLQQDSARTGVEKIKQDFLGTKRRSADRELASIQADRQRIQRERAGDEDPDRRQYVTAKKRSISKGRHWANPLRAFCNTFGLGTWEDRHAELDNRRNIYTEPDSTWSQELGTVSDWQKLEIKTSEGILRGSRYDPLNADPQQKRRVVIVYTGSGGPGYNQAPPIAEAYLKKGATVINVDYRGFGHSESMQKGKKCGTHLCEASLYQDGRAVYDYVRKLGYAPGDIILHGFSLGGAVASKVAADIAEENANKDQSTLTEEDRLGGLVLHSSIDSMKKAADSTFKGSGNFAWMGSGAYDTESHMRRLRRFDAHLPVHYRGGGSADHLSLKETKLHQDPKSRFLNSSYAELSDGHCDPECSDMNMGKQLDSIEQLVQHGRKAQLFKP